MSLTLCVSAEIGLEAERVYGGQERLDGVEGGAGHGGVLGDVAPPLGQHRVHRGHAVGGGQHLHEVVRLHQSWRRHQERTKHSQP